MHSGVKGLEHSLSSFSRVYFHLLSLPCLKLSPEVQSLLVWTQFANYPRVFWLLSNKYYGLVAINNRYLFLTALEATKSKVRADSMSDESPLPGSDMTPSSCNLTRQKGKEARWGLFDKDTNPIYESSPPNTITLRGFNIWVCGDTDTQSVASRKQSSSSLNFTCALLWKVKHVLFLFTDLTATTM